jgi:hypothetical protein
MPGYAPPEPTLEQLLDVRTNGQTMLTAAGGVALVILGLRTIFGGRRTTSPSS